MQDIAELERRITAAMERISRGLAARAEAAVAAAPDMAEAEAEIARLTEALDEERMANAQLTERLRVLHDRLEAASAEAAGKAQAAPADEVEALRLKVAAQEAEMAELRRVLTGAGHEIAALRAARAAEAAEVARLTAALEPLVDEARNA